jgi:predicted PurR-regulated permease PerM
MSSARQAILFGFAIAVLLVAAYVVRHGLLLIYISCIFAVVLSPAIDWLSGCKVGSWNPSRGAALALLGFVTAGLIVLISFFALPAIASQVRELVQQLPDLLTRLGNRIRVRNLSDTLDAGSISKYLTAHLPALTSFFGTIAGALTSTATVLLLTAYIALEDTKVLHWSMSLFPPEAADRLEKTLRRATLRMRKWLTGQLLLMLILGSASAIIFGAMQLRFFYLLALFAGVANFIPFVGPLATVVLAASMAAIDSPWKVLGVIIFYAIYQQTESVFLTPRIMQNEVKLSPVAVIIALLLGGELAGIAGAIVAVPSAALCSVLINEYFATRPPAHS